MSDFSSDLDELASVYLDGEATTEERTRVEADPTLLARVEELRSVRDALAAPVEQPVAAIREAAIQAALRQANVVSIDRARRRRMRALSIAAAIVLVLGAAGALIRAAGNQSTDKFQTVAGSIGSTSGDARGGQAPTAAEGAGAAGDSAFSTVGRPALGAFSDRSSLVAAAQAVVHDGSLEQAKSASNPASPTAGGNPSATTTAPAPPTCLVPAPPDSTNELYAATAVLEGRSVQVDVFTLADGSLALVVTDTASCAQLFTQSV